MFGFQERTIRDLKLKVYTRENTFIPNPNLNQKVVAIQPRTGNFIPISRGFSLVNREQIALLQFFDGIGSHVNFLQVKVLLTGNFKFELQPSSYL